MHLNTPILAAVALSLVSIPAICASHISGDPTSSHSPFFSACVVLTANGPKEAYCGASKPTAPFSQSASPQPGWQVVWLPATGHIWLGQHLPDEEFQFVLLSTGLARFQTSGGRGISVQLSRETGSRTNLPGEFLRGELERLQSSGQPPSDFPKYSLNLATLLGEDALWDVGPVFAPDGRTEIGRKVRGAHESPRIRTKVVSVAGNTFELEVVGEHGLKSKIRFDHEFRPIYATKHDYPMPWLGTNSVFLLETTNRTFLRKQLY